MKTTVLVLYIITFLIFFAIGGVLATTTYQAVTHLTGSAPLPNELSPVVSFGFETILLIIVFFLFLLPIGKKGSKINIYYFVEKLGESIVVLTKNWHHHNTRQENIFSIVGNFILYLSAMILYVFLILKLANTLNGVQTLAILISTFFVVKFFDLISFFAEKLDKASAENKGNGDGMSPLAKKIVLSIFVLVFIFLFMYLFPKEVNFFYGLLKDWLPFLDKNRLISI